MVKYLLLILVALYSTAVTAQTGGRTDSKSTLSKNKTATEKDCTTLVVDLSACTINGLQPNASMAAIKAKLPCFTGETEEGSAFNCGGGVFYLKHGIFFYTKLEAIEVRGKFVGKFKKDGKEVKLLGISKNELYELMGEFVDSEDEDDNNFIQIYEAGKGNAIRVKVVEGKVSEMSLHQQDPFEIEICE